MGLLRTKFEIKGNSVSPGEHYFVDKNGNRIKIDLDVFGENKDTTKVFVWGSSLGSATGPDNVTFQFQDFIVDKVNTKYGDDIIKNIKDRENNAR